MFEDSGEGTELSEPLAAGLLLAQWDSPESPSHRDKRQNETELATGVEQAAIADGIVVSVSDRAVSGRKPAARARAARLV